MSLLRWLARFLGFVPFYLQEVVLSNLQVAFDVLTPTHRMQPAIVALELEDLTDRQLIALANLITMTPGTLSLDVSDDHRLLYVHAMYVDDLEQFRQSLEAGFVERVRHVF